MTTEAPLATATVQEDNERVTVTRWRFAPGSQTGWHTHEHDYVVVPVIGGPLTIVAPDSTETISVVTAGDAYFRRAGVHHTVVNRTDAVIEFVETELK